jgi:hypothetical protein
MHATRAAVEEGSLPGGGVALLRSVKALGKLKSRRDINLPDLHKLFDRVYAPLTAGVLSPVTSDSQTRSAKPKGR